MEQWRIIDADGHVREMGPGALDWRKYIDPAYRSRAPRLGPIGNGDVGPLVDGKPFLTKQFHDKYNRPLERETQAQRPGMWEPEARLRDMDLDGISIAVLFGSTVGVRVADVPDPGLANAISRAYNDWLGDFCSFAPDRLKGVASLPLQDMELAVAELDRAVTELGIVTAQARPDALGKTLKDPYYFPLYEELQRLDIALSVHYVGGVTTLGGNRFDDRFSNHSFEHPFEQMLAVIAIVGGGVLDRFPKLRVAFLEGDSGWLPWWIDRLNGHYEKLAGLTPARAKPSEYIRGSQCYFSCECDESTIAYTAEVVGEDRLVFASDYWHWDGKFPGAVAAVSGRPGIPERVKRKVLGENAARLYKL